MPVLNCVKAVSIVGDKKNIYQFIHSVTFDSKSLQIAIVTVIIKSYLVSARHRSKVNMSIFLVRFLCAEDQVEEIV